MLYYRVKQEFDNTPQLKRKNRRRIHTGVWISGELYTPCELNREEKRGVIIPEEIFERVKIKKTETFWFFGARFSNDTGVKLPF